MIREELDKAAKTQAKIQVIGAGLPRTGTTSLKAALEILGFGPTHHMIELFKDGNHAKEWNRAFEKNEFDFDKLLKGSNSCLDSPSADNSVELARHYPNAKVILGVRDKEIWWKSINKTVLSQPTQHFWWPLLCLFSPNEAYFGTANFGPGGVITNWKIRYSGLSSDMMTKRIKETVEGVPAERLLIFDPEDGWEPLCKFLEVPVPDCDYPHLFEAATFNSLFRSMIWKNVRKWIYVLSTGAVVSAAVVHRAQVLKHIQ